MSKKYHKNFFILCAHIFLMGISLSAQERTFFTYNAGFVGPDYGNLAKKQYYISFDSIIQAKPFKYPSNEQFADYHYSNVFTGQDDFSFFIKNYVEMNNNYIIKNIVVR